MKLLPDPRIYAAPDGDALALLAATAAAAGSALQQTAPGRALIAAVGDKLPAGQGAAMQRSLERAGSAAARAALEQAIELALQARSGTVGLRMFAFPILLIAGGKAPGKIPGVVPDAGALRELLEVHGALGQAVHVGIGNALASAEALARIDPGSLHAAGQSGEEAAGSLQLAPEDIALETAEEQAHLRFLTAAALTPRDAPDLSETAANIGAWGMAWTRALAAQLAQPGLSLLPVPRPPLSVRRALAAGRFAWRETQFQLFLSKALRDMRARIGEPDARLAAFADASLRVRLSTPVDDNLATEFRWPLDPADDLGAVTGSILGLLEECRLGNVDVLPSVQPASPSH